MSDVVFRILGSLDASRDGRQLALGRAKQRAVLARLLVNANRVVTSNELIEALWPDKAPGKPQTAVQGYISKLRRILDPDAPYAVIVTERAGYRLPVAPDALDVFRFEALLKLGRRFLVARSPAEASTVLTEALELFRGPPLADFTYDSWAQSAIGRLVELRLACLEERLEADLRLGRHAELVGEISALVAEHPLREGLRGHLILALYRSGRQSEALVAYQEARTVLVEEFGIEPTRALQDLERKVLLQDPSLDLGPAERSARGDAAVRTLVFTDIEGSTRLVHRIGDDYAHLLVEHRRLVRDAFEAKEGRIVDNYGDSFFAIFDNSEDAVAACVDVQRAIGGYPWPPPVPLRVRVGVHAGRPVAVGEGFVGLDVHRGARICEAAHGGQVLLSETAARGLAGGNEVVLRDLGEHRLRGLSEPEHLFQLMVGGLRDAFPPLRTEQPGSGVRPDRSILLVVGDPPYPLVPLATPLAGSRFPHELIAARLVEVAEKTRDELAAELTRASSDLEHLRSELAELELEVRVAAFTSTSLGEDVVRLATEQAVDLVLLARDSEELAGGVVDESLYTVLSNVPCDVAICLVPDQQPGCDVVLVPFGGGSNDWAALELGAWLAAANGRPLQLLGVAGDPSAGRRDASRLLASASLAVQQLVGVAAEPVLVSPRRDVLVEASGGAAIVVVAVPDDWEARGLGDARTELVRAPLVTTILVRRGTRPGGLVPHENQTRFTWSVGSDR